MVQDGKQSKYLSIENFNNLLDICTIDYYAMKKESFPYELT